MDSPQLEDVLARFGDRWQIQRDDGGVWTAVRRPTPTAFHIVVGHDLDGLVVKLEAEAGQDGGT